MSVTPSIEAYLYLFTYILTSMHMACSKIVDSWGHCPRLHWESSNAPQTLDQVQERRKGMSEKMGEWNGREMNGSDRSFRLLTPPTFNYCL